MFEKMLKKRELKKKIKRYQEKFEYTSRKAREHMQDEDDKVWGIWTNLSLRYMKAICQTKRELESI